MEEGNKDTGTEVVFELEEQPEARGPPGTVPVARRDVADTLGDEELPRSVKDFLSKYGDASDETVPGPDAEGGGRRRLAPGRHEYVSTHEYADIFGGSGKINAWNPYVYKSSEFSLGQTAVIRGDPMQAIEVGWQDFRNLYGDYYPHLFIFYRTAGSATGDNVGGYNRDVDGWVQVSASYHQCETAPSFVLQVHLNYRIYYHFFLCNFFSIRVRCFRKLGAHQLVRLGGPST